MEISDIKAIRLYRQHFTAKADRHTVLHDLNGLQAQFMAMAEHALKIRCSEPLTYENFGDGLVKNWTLRGTVHIFNRDDLPVFKYDRGNYRSEVFQGYGIFSDYTYKYSVELHPDYPEEIFEEYRKNGGAWTLSPEDQRKWSRFILEKVAEGICEREELKDVCAANGMTKPQLDSMFDQWGGGMRDLCERGFLNYKVQEKKAFELCPEYIPLSEADALKEQVTRYFEHFAPATLRDASYYFGLLQTRLKETTRDLPMKSIEVDGKAFHYLGELPSNCPDIPEIIFLGGFDQLMLGYRKTDSLYLEPENLRKIFNLAGIVMPAVLINGTVSGRWRKKGKKLVLEMFKPTPARLKKHLETEAERVFTDFKTIEIINI